MSFWLSITDGGSAERLARKLLVSSVKLAIGSEAVQVGLAHTAEGLVTPLLRDEAPKDTGALAAGLRAHVSSVGGESIISFESDQDYWRFVAEGTGEHHQPDPHSAWDVYGVQAFEIGGQTIVTMHTHHTGQEADPFPERAMQRAEPLIMAALEVAGERLLVGWAQEFRGPS